MEKTSILPQVVDGKLINTDGTLLQLKGVSIGGWMNLEDFIIGYPGAEHTLRRQMADIMGRTKTQLFFDCLHHYFFNEADVAFIKEQGANFIRLPLNYRQFESDNAPFTYLELGFRRLDQVIDWCARHKLYVVLDLHAAQGWQSARWHCDNANGCSLLWEQPHFQDRVVAFWQYVARYYRDNATVIAYELLNEPVTGWTRGHDGQDYRPNWQVINSLYTRLVEAIREVDSAHIIVVEGDERGHYFSGLSSPPDDNMIYSSHNYSRYTLAENEYPAIDNGEIVDRTALEQQFLLEEGTQFTSQIGAPLWIGEFGLIYNTYSEAVQARLRALDDQISIFEAHDAHWSTWTYKDVGIMGWVHVDPESDYMQIIGSITQAKADFNADFSTKFNRRGQAWISINELIHLVNGTLEIPLVSEQHQNAVTEQMLHHFFGILMQPAYARIFSDLPESRIQDILQAFEFKNCLVHSGVNHVLTKHYNAQA